VKNAKKVSEESQLSAQPASEKLPEAKRDGLKKGWLKKLRGGLLLVIGYLLSPLSGLVSSTAFTLVIVALIHFKILDTPDLFSTQQSIDILGS